MFSTSKGDPSQLPMPCHECVTGKQDTTPNTRQKTLHHSITSTYIHPYQPSGSEVLDSTGPYTVSIEEYHLQWLASLQKAVPARTMGVLELSIGPHLRGWPSAKIKGSRIVIPVSMRNQVLQAIHLGHQGENRCILRARESVFWPGISTDIRQMVKDCDLCNKNQPAQPKLPIMQPDLPARLWEKLGTDFFEFNGKKYLMVVDHYSRFPVIRLLNDMTSHTVCNHFTSIQAECGLPKWHHTTQQFSISPSSKQPSRKSNWNLQTTIEEGTGGE